MKSGIAAVVVTRYAELASSAGLIVFLGDGRVTGLHQQEKAHSHG